jgi:hypothetical protein
MIALSDKSLSRGAKWPKYALFPAKICFKSQGCCHLKHPFAAVVAT